VIVKIHAVGSLVKTPFSLLDGYPNVKTTHMTRMWTGAAR